MRQALALLVDKDSVEKHIYGRTGRASANFIYNPERFRSKNTKYEFNVDKAIDILEKAGWKKGADGIREKDGKKLKYLYQTSINQPRQKTQAIVKQACPEGRHRPRAEVGDGVGVLLVRRLQSRHLSALLCGPADVQQRSAAAGPGRVPASVLLVGSGVQSQQVAGPQHHALAEQGIRRRSSTPHRWRSIR